MTETTNYKLKKPGDSDNVRVDVLNGNMDVIDRELKQRATLDENGKLVQDIDCGVWDTDPVEAHNATATAHANLLVDGNNVEAVDTSESLEEHMANPLAHQNLVIYSDQERLTGSSHQPGTGPRRAGGGPGHR